MSLHTDHLSLRLSVLPNQYPPFGEGSLALPPSPRLPDPRGTLWGAGKQTLEGQRALGFPRLARRAFHVVLLWPQERVPPGRVNDVAWAGGLQFDLHCIANRSLWLESHILAVVA